MKKILSITVMLLMMLSSIKLIYADENIVVEKRVLDNGNAEVVLRVDENVQAYGGNITYNYDSTNMQISEEMIASNENYLIVVNEDYQNEGNKIRVVFATVTPAKGDLILIEFEPIGDNDINVDSVVVDQFELTSEQGTAIEGINQESIQVNSTTGPSMVDENTMKVYSDEEVAGQESDVENTTEEETESKDEQTPSNSQEKDQDETNGSDKNESNESNSEVVIIIVGGVVIIAIIGFIVYKKRFKK